MSALLTPSKQVTAPKPVTEPKQTIQTWRQQLKTQQSALERDFFQHKNTAKSLKKQSLLTDKLLREIWLQANIHKGVALIAVGGYGREELFPYSDIDLLILLPSQHDYVLNEQVEAIIGQLWDIGLNVGHSVRTLDECMSEANSDVTVQTNLLESRLLAGNKANYQQFVQAIDALMQPEVFFAAKFKEQDNRHAKFNDTAYSLEPNIKESPGGLRDLHMILWLARSQQLGKNWHELAKNKLITDLELRQIKRHERNLQTLRIRLHYLAKRREDRLLFDFQNELAADLGFVTTARKRASEQLMQSYYRSVKYINLINEILIKTLEFTLTKAAPKISSVSANFEAHNQWLEAKTTRTLQQYPSAILEGFLLLQQHPELEGMGANLLRQLQRHLPISEQAVRALTPGRSFGAWPPGQGVEVVQCAFAAHRPAGTGQTFGHGLQLRRGRTGDGAQLAQFDAARTECRVKR